MSDCPTRIQRLRTKGFRLQDCSPDGRPVVFVGRPSGWGNRCKLGDRLLIAVGGEILILEADPILAVAWYRDLVSRLQPVVFEPLRGKHLACWCPLDQPCHADILLELANP